MMAKRVTSYDEREAGVACYWKDADGTWYILVPKFDGMLGNLRNHKVEEHADGTISVTPSILITAPHLGQVHGYLTRGEWIES